MADRNLSSNRGPGYSPKMESVIMTYEGSAFIALFLDMRNVVSSHFLTVCTVQVSVLVLQPREQVWKATRSLSLQSLGCRHVLIFA